MSTLLEYFNSCPLIKVKLPIKIKKNIIQTILDYVEQKSSFNLIRLENGFRLVNPKREIRFSDEKYGLINTLDIFHNDLHFDPEIEGLHLAIIIKLVKEYIFENYNKPNLYNNKNEIYVKLCYESIHEKFITIVIDKLDSSELQNIIKFKNSFIYKDTTFTFKKPKNNHVFYLKCIIQNNILINLEEEEKIKKITGLIYYAFMNIKHSNIVVDSSDNE